MDASKLKDVLNRAQRLTQMDANGELNEIARNAKDKGKMEYANDNIQLLQENQVPQQQMQQQAMPRITHTAQRNGLPKEIFESFAQNPIDTSSLGTSTSILDQIGITKQQPTQVQQRVVTESNQPVKHIVREQSSSVNGGIDYSLIRMIVEESVKKSVAALSKKLISENKSGRNDELRAIHIGDKFSFVTENGDLYEAKLIFKKNIKKK